MQNNNNQPLPLTISKTAETLQSPASIKNFIDDFTLLQKSWTSKSPPERLLSIQNIVNRSLNQIGIPNVATFKSVQLSPETDKGTQANFSGLWEMRINQSLLNSNQLSGKSAATLAGFIYHETRHAEQFFRIAQFLSQSKVINNKLLNANEISGRTNIPIKIVQAATQTPLTEKQSKNANILYQSIYGSGSKYREDVLKKLNIVNSRYSIVTERYNQAIEKVTRNPGSISEGKIDQLFREVQTVYESEYKPAYKLYSELPEERDAFETGNLLKNSYLQRLLRSKSLPEKQDEIPLLAQPNNLLSTLQNEKISNNTIYNEFANNRQAVEEKFSSELSLAEKRADAIIAKLEKAGVSQDSDEFKSAFVGVVKNLKNLEIDEKKDILTTQGFSDKALSPQQLIP